LFWARSVFEGPNNWQPVKAKLTEVLSGIVSTHLPDTISRLWCELSMNLTAAPWLLADRPCIEIASLKGAKRATIEIKGRQATYVLNQSEVHTFGLAWFFVRYLSYGRFHKSCMILDDPAQDMDQTSFRDLCRLFETFVRIHRIYSISLALIVFLNQESRAIDAARATGGVLSVLGWIGEQEATVRSVAFGEGSYRSPDPAQFFRHAV